MSESLRDRSIDGVRVHWAEPRLHGSSADLETLAKMNEQPGTARAFSRAVRRVINFRGQHRMFMQRAHEVGEFPPIRVFWGEDDALIPRRHGDALVAATEGIEMVAFPGAGHYLHQQQPSVRGAEDPSEVRR